MGSPGIAGVQIDVGLVTSRPDSFCPDQKEDMSQDFTLEPYEMNDVANVFYRQNIHETLPPAQGCGEFDRCNLFEDRPR